jgi:hypothetical protein
LTYFVLQAHKCSAADFVFFQANLRKIHNVLQNILVTGMDGKQR